MADHGDAGHARAEGASLDRPAGGRGSEEAGQEHPGGPPPFERRSDGGFAGHVDNDASGGRARSASIWSPTVVAYVVAAAVALVAFATPIAVVTSFEGESVRDTAVQPLPQWLVIVGLAIAASGGRLRRAWPGAFALGLLFIVLGGLLGAFGGDLLIDMRDSDAGGETRAGATVVGVAAALAASAIVVDCRAKLVRIAPGRPHVWGWSVAVVTAPLAVTVVLVSTAIAFGGGSSLVIVVVAPVTGAVVGGALVRRWATLPGQSDLP